MFCEFWEEIFFDILEQYSELFEDECFLKELVEMLGWMWEVEIEIEEEIFEKIIIWQEWKVDEIVKVEIVGVYESDDFNNFLSLEVSLLGDEDIELFFLKKYVDKNLMIFCYEDCKLVCSEDQFIEINQWVW